MIISPNRFIGSIVKRTCDALNADSTFLKNVSKYEFWPSCCTDGRLHLWHYPGTPNEIANILVQLGKVLSGATLKFPAVLDFHPIRQVKERGAVYYTLAIIAPVRKDWTTEEREAFVFDPLLRPIYAEFIKQLKMSPYFATNYDLKHDYYEVFTTGGSSETVAQRYGDYIDAIELHNLQLTPRPTLCAAVLQKAREESEAVTDDINNILQSY